MDRPWRRRPAAALILLGAGVFAFALLCCGPLRAQETPSRAGVYEFPGFGRPLSILSGTPDFSIGGAVIEVNSRGVARAALAIRNNRGKKLHLCVCIALYDEWGALLCSGNYQTLVGFSPLEVDNVKAELGYLRQTDQVAMYQYRVLYSLVED